MKKKKYVLTVLFCLSLPVLALAQQKSISGNVKDAEGNPLPGVTVRIEGKQQGTITSTEGRYTVNAAEGDKIIFSFLGMEPVLKTVGKQSVINAVLHENTVQLDEVVAIGYGTQKKSDLTGSVASISTKDMEVLRVASVDQLLQGQVAGVSVQANSGAPGEGMKVLIRGSNSMNGSNEPLYVIDGFPIEVNQAETARDATADDAQQYTNILSTLNPNDIEKIEVLKDASATAIYGSKGANGVVLITTKKGSSEQSGKDVVDVNYSFSIDQVARKIPMLEPWEWARNHNEYLYMTGSSLPSFNGRRDANGVYRPSVDDIRNQTNTIYGSPWGVDWQDELFRMAETHNLSLSVRGRNDRTNYVVSGNVLANEGIVPNTDYNRLVLRGAFNRNVSDKVKISFDGQVTHSIGNQKPTAGNTSDNMGVILNSLRYNNVLPAYFPDGSYFNTKGDNSAEMSLNHPLVFVNEVKNKLETSAAMGSTGLEYTPVKGLTFKSTLNYRYNFSVRDVYFPKSTQQGTALKGLSANSWSQTSNFVNENFVNYAQTFRKIHELGAMAGFSYEQTDRRSLNMRVFNFFSDDLQGMNLSEGALPQIPNNEIIKTKMMSYYGRLNYTFDKRYLLTTTFRGDGSSKFGKNNKWAYFPSFALAWRASEEKFLKPVKWLTNLKVRAGYGLSGSQAIAPYQSVGIVMNPEGYYFGQNYAKGLGVGVYGWTSAGGSYSGLGEPDLKWETTGQFNAGLDISLLKNRYNLVIDFYNKITRDLHQSVELPLESGYSYTVRNMGTMRNRGFEASFKANLRINQVKWNPSVNYSMNRNKILSLGGQYDYILAPALVSGDGGEPFIGHVSMVGYAMGSFYGYLTNGIIQNEAQAEELTASVGRLEPGEVRYVDVTGDGKVDSNDKVILGNANPDFELNFNNLFTWKNLEFSFNIAGVYGHDILNLNLLTLEAGTFSSVESARMRDAWTVYNASNTQPKIGPSRVKVISDRYLEDGSYIKLRNVMLAWNFNVKRYKWISKAQFYVKGTNLLTLTKYFGYSPEINQYQSNQKPGVDYGSYPLTRAITAGFSVSF